MAKKSSEKIAVIGLGRIGLPLSLVLADHGFGVMGIDIDTDKTSTIEKGMMPFKEDGADTLLKKHLGKRFNIVKLNDINKCDTVIICVGTVLKDDFTPNTEDIFKVFNKAIPHFSRDTLIVLRSTVEPNGTKRIYNHLVKKLKNNFYLVYAPERIAEGFAIKELYEIPQIIGSFDMKAANKAAKVFNKFSPEIINTDPLTAELVKLVLNTHRYANFAVANELMMMVDHYGKDIHKVIELANKDYLRGGIPSPGFAAGPCLVKDSFFIKQGTPFNTLVTGSFAINDGLPAYFIRELKKRTKLKGEKVAFLGLSFKRNIDDARESLPLKMVELLKENGSKVKTHDPYLEKSDLDKVLDGAKVVVIAIDHDEYREINLNKIKEMVGDKSLICDIWNVLGKGEIFFEINSSQ